MELSQAETKQAAPRREIARQDGSTARGAALERTVVVLMACGLRFMIYACSLHAVLCVAKLRGRSSTAVLWNIDHHLLDGSIIFSRIKPRLAAPALRLVTPV